MKHMLQVSKTEGKDLKDLTIILSIYYTYGTLILEKIILVFLRNYFRIFQKILSEFKQNFIWKMSVTVNAIRCQINKLLKVEMK